MKILISLLCLLLLVQAAPESHKVNSLKGYYNFNVEFDMYSGFLDIQASPKISTHYVFITSKNNPETDDVVVWLNGGPGCSSLLGTLPTHSRLPDRTRSSVDLPRLRQSFPLKKRTQLEQQCKHPLPLIPPRRRLFNKQWLQLSIQRQQNSLRQYAFNKRMVQAIPLILKQSFLALRIIILRHVHSLTSWPITKKQRWHLRIRCFP